MIRYNWGRIAMSLEFMLTFPYDLCAGHNRGLLRSPWLWNLREPSFETLLYRPIPGCCWARLVTPRTAAWARARPACSAAGWWAVIGWYSARAHFWLVQVGAAVKLNCCPGHKCVFVDSSFSCAADRSDNFFMKSFEWDVSRSSRYFTIFTITPFLDILRINHTMCSNNSVFTLLTQSIKTHVFLWKHLIILGISFFPYMYVLRRLCAFALQCHYFLLLVKSTKTKRRCWGILGRLYIASENPFPFTHWLQDRILFDSMITNWIVPCFSDIQMEKEAAEMDPADLL